MSKNWFGFLASCLVVGLIATGFLPPDQSHIRLVPVVVVACLAFAFFRYEQASVDARAQMAGILAVFFLGAYFYQDLWDDHDRLMADAAAACSSYGYIDETDRRPFSRVCTRARDWARDRQEPPLGHLW